MRRSENITITKLLHLGTGIGPPIGELPAATARCQRRVKRHLKLKQAHGTKETAGRATARTILPRTFLSWSINRPAARPCAAQANPSRSAPFFSPPSSRDCVGRFTIRPPGHVPPARLAPQRSLLAPSPHAQVGSEKRPILHACMLASILVSKQPIKILYLVKARGEPGYLYAGNQSCSIRICSACKAARCRLLCL
jgi:hypothetical protein